LSVPSKAEAVDREIRSSTSLARATRFGLVGYGFVHLLIGWVAIRVALEGRGGTATGQGALAQLALEPLGRVSLAALALGFAGLALWQVLAAAVGYRDLDGFRRHAMRAGAAARVLVYGYFGISAGRLVLHQGSGGSPRTATASVLAQPTGVLLVAGAGICVSVVGAGLVVFGLRRQFLGQLDDAPRSVHRQRLIVLLGQVGYVAKGLAFVMIGWLLCWAALTDSPGKTGGLDHSFAKLLGDSLGGPVVVVAGVGIGCFGLYLFARARHLDTSSLTS
jgi:hypothetical protein